MEILEDQRDFSFSEVSPSNFVKCVRHPSHAPRHSSQIYEESSSLIPEEGRYFLNEFRMRIVVFRPLRQCRDTSFEEFASVGTWAHVEMRRLFKPAAVGALRCWGPAPSEQHFTGAAVPGSLLAIPELVHLGGLVKGGADIVPCDGVEGVIVHEVQLRVQF